MSENTNEDALEQRVRNSLWEFGREEGGVIAPAIRFDARGKITGHVHHNEVSWRIDQGRLEFIASSGAISTRFVEQSVGEEGRLTLSGRFGGGDSIFRLRELNEAPVATSEGVVARRNLVVTRAGNSALFPDWKPAASRSWDLAVSFYGEGRPEWGQEYFHAARGPKWEPIHHWLTADREIISRYDYIWFPDDDILTTWENVNDLFQVCHDYDLQLAQPALTSDSFICHAVTKQDPNCLLRFTAFVEGMVPVFSSGALRLCLPVLQEESRFGWGHDWVFPMLLGYPPSKIGIVDACPVKHTRPPGANTDFAMANTQMAQVVYKYGAKFMDHRVRGRIFRQPEPGVFVP
jgi:hypothetical protein